jgi:hypothetical protein
MKYLLLLTIILNLNAQELKDHLELNVFGLSYHTNRNYDLNEINPGVGVGLVLNKKQIDPGMHLSMVIAAGTYKDSYSETAFYAIGGPRLTVGYDHSFHVSGELGIGYINGSGKNGAITIPIISAGYDRVNICFTADLLGYQEEGQKTNRAIAAFLRVKLFDF